MRILKFATLFITLSFLPLFVLGGIIELLYYFRICMCHVDIVFLGYLLYIAQFYILIKTSKNK